MNLTSSSLVYRTVAVQGLNLFYREAGPADGPVIRAFLARMVDRTGR